MTYTVWLFTRPLVYATAFPVLRLFSDRRELRHWGVLVSDMTLLDAKAIMLRSREYDGDANTPLGTMYELCRQEDRNTVNVIRPFGMYTIRKEWQAFSAQFVGVTELTHDMIIREGNSSTRRTLTL